MKKFALVLKPIVAALVVGACSTSPTMPENAWKIAPVKTVRHGGANAAAGYFALGRYREGQGAVDRAIAEYERAIEADPGHVAAWSAIGSLQVQMGRFEAGLPALERAVSLAPSASHLHNNLGYAQLLAGREEAAATALRRAIELDGNNRRAWANLASAYRRLGIVDEAELADARAVGTWSAGAATASSAGSLATQVARTGAASATSSAASATSVSPVATQPPVESIPLTALHDPTKPTALPQRSANARAVAAAPAVSAPAMAVPPRTLLVKIAENVFELRNEPPSREAAITEAAAIMAAVASSPAPAVTPPLHETPAATQAETAASVAPSSPKSASLASRNFRYEVSNGQGRKGLARRVAEYLVRGSLPQPYLTDQKPFVQQTTVVQYRPGRREAARQLAEGLPFQAALVAARPDDLTVDVRLVLGHDLKTNEACGALGLCEAVAAVTPGPLTVAQQALPATN